MKQVNLALIEDNFVIRDLIKSELERLESHYDVNFHTYSADNGLEGLGNILVLDPDVVIIDTTLPKYCGREILDYLRTNGKFASLDKRVILISQGNLGVELPENYLVLDKSQYKFTNFLLESLEIFLGLRAAKPESESGGLRTTLAKIGINLANRSDLQMFRYYSATSLLTRLSAIILWLLAQIALSFVFTIYRLVTKRPPEEYLEQYHRDSVTFCVRYYPTLVTIISAVFLLVFQLGSFVAGGIVIFNNRIDLVYAFRQESQLIEFNKSEVEEFSYDDTRLEFTEGGVQLSPAKMSSAPEDPGNLHDDDDVVPDSFPIGASSEELLMDPTGNEVELAEEKENVFYPTEAAALTVTSPVHYSSLNQITAQSNLDLVNQNEEKLVEINYQLSPNGEEWYYFDEEAEEWTLTEQGFVTSNNLEVVNENLDGYTDSLDTGKLYIRIYLKSNDQAYTPILNDLRISKENEILDPTSYQEPKTGISEKQVIEEVDFSILKPRIFNASYYNGEKIIRGKLLANEKRQAYTYQLSDDEVENYIAKVHFADAEGDVGELIGVANAYLNANGEIEFTLREAAAPGGHVVAQFVHRDIADNASTFSPPVENSTFTVDSSNDDGDDVLDGLCATAAGECSLRAAIEEANNVSGADNIEFGIAVTDPGYRDYDLANTAGSGDSFDDDDYWQISLASDLPAITSEVLIVGSSQRTNQFDSNTNGPEIVVNAASGSNGFSFDSADGSRIDEIIVNGGAASSNLILIENSNDVVLTNSYVGTDAIAMAKVPASGANSGVIISDATNVYIGQDSDDGNIITADESGVYINGNSQAYVRGNIIGFNRTVTDTLRGDFGVRTDVTGTLNTVIGGNSSAHRNYIDPGVRAGVFINSGDGVSTANTVFVQNNFFATDTSGNLINRGEQDSITIAGGDYVGSGNSVEIRNNLIKGGGLATSGGAKAIDIDADGDNHRYLVAENTISDSRSCLEYDGKNTATTTSVAYFYNNYCGGKGDPDPYFGVVANATDLVSVRSDGSRIVAKGNIFEGGNVTGTAIHNYISSQYNRTDEINTADYTIGGQGSFPGSLCEGLEKNCINNYRSTGISLFETVARNEATIYDDNTFAYDNGLGSPYNAYELRWKLANELFTGQSRRTDLPDGYQINEMKKFDAQCINSADCPSTGDTNGRGGWTSSMVSATVYDFYPLSNLQSTYTSGNFNVAYLEKVIAFDGTLNDNSQIQIERPNLIFWRFSPDGSGVTDPPDRGVSRSIDGYTYNDRGEPWTSNPTATRDLNTLSFSYNQAREVELVDANPIYDANANEWTITVNSTGDEDNVSVAGLDDGIDGGGNYSGGGLEGPDGLANGRTTLREAIYVANNRPGYERIVFDIPESDPGFINPDGSRASTSEPAGTYTTTDTGYFYIDIDPTPGIITDPNDQDGFHIDGYSQLGASRNTTEFGQPLNTVLKIHLTNFIQIQSSNVRVSGLNVWALAGHSINTADSAIVGANDNWIEGNYFGVDINGEVASTEFNRFSVRSSGIESRGNIIGTNGDGDGDSGERNLFAGSAVEFSVGSFNDIGEDLTISGNYIGTDYTGSNCIRPDSGNDRTAIFINWENSQIGSDLDGTSDEEEGNIMGCINSAHRAVMRSWGENTIVANNYFNVTPVGAEIIGQDSDQEALSIVGEGQIIENNQIRAYPSGHGILIRALTGRNYENIAIRNNNIYSGTGLGIFTNSKTGGEAVEQIVIENNSIRDFGQAGIYLPENSGRITLRNNEVTNIGTHNIDLDPVGEYLSPHLAPTLPDDGDSDSGPNNLQNFPVIQQVEYLGGEQYLISGDLNGDVTEAPWQIEICESDNNPSGHGGCLQTLSSFTVSGGVNPLEWQTTVEISGATATEERYFSALATNASGSTSEFSANAATTDPDIYSIVPYPIVLISPIAGIEITDRTPRLDWNDSGDPDLVSYEVYLGTDPNNLEKVGEVPGAQTFLDISELLDYTDYFWQVVGIRNDGSESGASPIESFTAVESVTDLQLVYPIGGIEIDERQPQFTWQGEVSEDASNYELYLLPIGERGTVPSEEQLNSLLDLDNLATTTTNIDSQTWIPGSNLQLGAYIWQVRAVFPDGEPAAESRVEQFTIIEIEDFIAEVEQTAGSVSDSGSGSDESIFASSGPVDNALRLSPILLASTLLLVTGTAAVGSGNLLLSLGALLGILVPKRKKYWGIVLDVNSMQPVPFAAIYLYKGGSLIDRTVSDLEGRYAFNLEVSGDYTLQVKATGYQYYSNNIAANGKQVNHDIALVPLEAGLKGGLKQLLFYQKKKVVNAMRLTNTVLLIIGFFYTVYATFVAPIAINFLLIAVYVAFLVLMMWRSRTKKMRGMVTEGSTNEAIPGVVVRIFDERGQIEDIVITAGNGQLQTVAKAGQKEVYAHKPNFSDKRDTFLLSQSGSFASDIKMHRLKQVDEANRAIFAQG
jgi:CheY-like chemotaxis protein